VQSKRTSSASSSRARRASSKVTHPALIGVDLEHTDDEDETDQSYAAGVRRGYREGRAALEAQARTSSIEIHIPVKKESPAQGPSSSTSVDGASRDEMNGDDTPATSVAVTPADSETNKPRKRVSASARARELRSSAFSLSTARGLKRDASALSADDSTIESSDAALARALQMEEYQRTGVKRQKLSMGRSKPALEIQNSTDDDDMLTDLGSPPRHKAGDSLGAGNEAVIADSEDSALSDLDDLADRIGEQVESEMEDLYQPDSEQSDGESSVPQDDGVPVVGESDQVIHSTSVSASGPLYSVSQGPRRRRATITGRSRALPDFEVLQQSSTTRVSRVSEQNFPSLCIYLITVVQAVRERRKLEEQHPCIKTMWDDLKKTPPITPVAAEQPPGITRKLKSYQLEGLNWMMQQEKTQYRGGLLGDEMGMGKTIQAVSLIMSDYPVGKPSLVVVPPVALMQWQSEIKVCGACDVLMLSTIGLMGSFTAGIHRWEVEGAYLP